jgi:hypothetical protein
MHRYTAGTVSTARARLTALLALACGTWWGHASEPLPAGGAPSAASLQSRAWEEPGVTSSGNPVSIYRSTMRAPAVGAWSATFTGQTRSLRVAQSPDLAPSDRTIQTQLSWAVPDGEVLAEAGYRLRDGSRTFLPRETILAAVGGRYFVHRDLTLEGFVDYRQPMASGFASELELSAQASYRVVGPLRLQVYGFGAVGGAGPAIGAGITARLRF